MPEAVTVWAVELGRGSLRERQGTLSLEPDALEFTARDGYSHVRIELPGVRKARRVRGSPILLVVHEQGGATARTAFYFVQPPPLEAIRGEQPERPSPLGGVTGRSGRRKARRQNAGYLGLWNRELKHEVAEWERAVREAARAARG